MGVLDILKGNASTCPCCSKWQEYEGFQQLIELKNSGVIIYLHRSTEVATRDEGVANTTTEDVYILHNVNNNNILSADVLAQIDKNKIYCPRCRKTYEHAQKLFQLTTGRDNRDVIGICDHCCTKARLQEPCHKCDEVIRKFLKAYNARRQSPNKAIKTWLAKIVDIINKTKQKVRSTKHVHRSKSETDFDQLSYRGLSKSVRDLKIELMFHSITALSDTNINRTRKYSKNQEGDRDNVEKTLEPIYMIPKHMSNSNKTDLLNDLEIKSGHLRKDDQLPALSTDPFTKSKVKEGDKRQEKTSERIFWERSKAGKEMLATNQKHLSTAAKDEDKRTKLILTDNQPKKQRNLNITRKTAEHSEKKYDVSAPADILISMNKKSKIESQETQKTKPATQSKKRHYDVTTESEDLFKDNRYQTTNKLNRFQEKDDLVPKKQKQKNIGREPQAKDVENGLMKTETYTKEKSIDVYNTDKRQPKSNKSETSPLRETKKPLIEETKATKAKTKDKTQADVKRGQDKEKTQIKEMETRDKGDKPNNELEKENHEVVDMKEFKKLQDEHAKNKDKETKQQKQADMELQKVKDGANKKVKEVHKNIHKLDLGQLDTKVKEKDKPKDEDKTQIKELNDITGATVDNELLKLMQKDKHENADLRALKKLQEEQTKNKEKETKQRKQAEVELEKIKVTANKNDKELLPLGHLHRTSSASTIYSKEDLKMATENYKKELLRKPREIIIGEQITKYKQTPYLLAEKQDTAILMNMYSDVSPLQPHIAKEIKKESETETDKMYAKIKMEPKDKVDPESTKGIIRYSLSDRTFIDKGWTMLPTEKVVRKMNVYRMRPAHPEFDWFEHNKNKRLMLYDTGEKLADFDDKGRGRWYYKSGQIALEYYDAEETNAQQRFVVYSSGEPDERGRSYPITILATFDYLGNGIVFDHGGKIRLKYNQTEGVVLDRSIGPVSHWKWHTLNDPPVLQQVMIDTQMALKDPEILKMRGPHDKKPRPDNEEMLAIEFDNFIKEKSKKLSQKFKPFQIKMKALKINEHFSLRVLDQATVYLIFRDGSTNVKLNIGMVLDHQEIVDTDTAEVGEVSNNLERFPARTDSLAELQRSVAYAQRYERARTERDRRLRPSEPCASADILTSAISRSLKPIMRMVPTASTCTTVSTKNTRRMTNNLYYNSRIL